MSKNLFILFFTLSSIISLAKVPIPGTGVSIKPPKGFTKAPNFSGFMLQEKLASIMVIELPVSTIYKSYKRL